MAELSLRRYQIRRVLGQGGSGTVYEALDTRTQALVALKTVESSIAEHLYRLKHEFRSLAEVQHRNLVHFGELACEDDKWFFTMELVRGPGFLEYCRPPDHDAEGTDPPSPPSQMPTDRIVSDDGIVTATVLQVCGARAARRALAEGSQPETPRRARLGSTFDEARLRSALRQLVEALSALHHAGHVHRDVKPSNVLVGPDGRVVLLDFGLVMELAQRERSSVDRSGTPAYMAPEQIEGLAIGPEADWYAVGAMLYEALTGRLPFHGSVEQIFRAKVQIDARAPGELVASVPEDLDALCAGLLRRDPRARLGEEQVRAALGLAPRRRGAQGDAAPFVGRRDERAAFAAAIAAVGRGEARALVVEGEPGVGKSALVQEVLAGLPPDAVVLAGRCYEQESVPWKGVDSIVDALSAYLIERPEDELARLLAGGARYLAAAFPVLARVPAIHAIAADEREVASQARLREQAFGELAALFAAVARAHLLVIFMDDLQWVDADGLALLERAVLPASGTPCLFVATLRSLGERAPGLAELLAGVERLPLGGLSEDESHALWHALRPAGEAALGQAQGERAVREAGGHPLFLAELARAARAGQLDRHAGARLVDVLRDRVAERDETERRFLEAVAVAGAPTPYEILARAAGLEVADALTCLGALKGAQLVRVSLAGDARCVEPYHDRVREAIVGGLREDGSRDASHLHLRLARALLAATPSEHLSARVFTIVHHLSSARALLVDPAERVRAAQLHLLASREARLATAYKRATSYARTGLELLGDDAWTQAYPLCRDLQLARLEALFLSGDPDGARAVFAAVRPRLVQVEDFAALASAWVQLETGQGHPREAIAAGREALAELGVRVPRRGSMASVLREYVAVRWVQARRPAAQLAALPELTDARLKGVLEILIALAPPLFFTDTNLLTWMLLRVARLSMQHGVCDVSSYGIAGYGVVLAGAFGEHEEARDFGELALALDRRFANPRLAARLAYVQGGYILPWVRPFAEGEALLGDAHRLAVKHGDAAYEVYAVAVLSVLGFCASRHLADVRATAEHAARVAARRADQDMARMPEAQARQAAALAGATGSTRDLGLPGSSDAELRAQLDDATTPIALFYYYFCNAELAFLGGDLARTEALLGEAHRRKEGIFAVPTTVELCLLDALAAARRHDEPGTSLPRRLSARFTLDACVRKLDAWAHSCPANFEAHARLARAERARVAGRHALASDLYLAAAASAERHGAPKREAMALELAAAHARDQGDQARAMRLLGDAIAAYRRWGAHGRADELEAGAPRRATPPRA